MQKENGLALIASPKMAGEGGLEPPTYRFGDGCSTNCATPLYGGGRGI